VNLGKLSASLINYSANRNDLLLFLVCKIMSGVWKTERALWYMFPKRHHTTMSSIQCIQTIARTVGLQLIWTAQYCPSDSARIWQVPWSVNPLGWHNTYQNNDWVAPSWQPLSCLLQAAQWFIVYPAALLSFQEISFQTTSKIHNTGSRPKAFIMLDVVPVCSVWHILFPHAVVASASATVTYSIPRRVFEGKRRDQCRVFRFWSRDWFGQRCQFSGSVFICGSALSILFWDIFGKAILSSEV